MQQYRLNRLFDPTSGNCFDVAVDHGFFGELRHVRGIEDMATVVATIIEAAPDAIQLTIGQAHHLQSVPGRTKPALVLRTDVANIYGLELPERQFSLMIGDAVEQALRLDATCIVVNLFDVPGHPDIKEDCLRNILSVKNETERYGMPLMVEPLVMQPQDAGGYGVNGDLESIMGLVRQAVELGADIIKADPTDDVSDYHQVVGIAGAIPVLVRGGGRVSDQVLLERTHALMQQGARGIVYGRNVVQHEDPAGITRALMAIVHEGASVEAAAAIVGAD